MTGIVAALAGCGDGAGSGFSIAVTPASLSTTSSTTGTATAAVTGGASPFTYQWSLVLGSGIKANTPNAAMTTFSAIAIGSSQKVAAFTCNATDNDGKIAFSNTILVTVYLGTGIGGGHGLGADF